MMKWAEYMETGHSVIDEHHRELLRRINLLITVITERRNQQRVEEVLDFISAYADFHFDTEDKIMVSMDYPQIEPHRAEHDGFREALVKLQADFRGPRTTASLALDTQRFLADWWHHHVLVTDRNLGRFATARQAA